MKFLKILILSIPLILLNAVKAQENFETTASGNFDDEKTEEQRQDNKRNELNRLQEEEEVQVDSFGEDIYNKNVDPKSFEVDEADEVQQIIE